MDRRRFLRALLSGATAAAFAPALLHGGQARAGEAAAFAAGLDRHPWLAGWKSVRSETLGPATAAWQGRLPRGLIGSLYRNGPAWTERAGFRYEHWFDGDGMVHRWQLGENQVRHQARMVATPKFVREQQAGRFLYPTAGTSVPDLQPVRNNDDANTANTSVTMIGGRLFALCEAGSAFELDPEQLTTLGPVTWRPDLAAVPFSAHPQVERDGTLWNFGSVALSGGMGLVIWKIGADAHLRQAQVLETPVRGYLHSFAMTERHLLFMLMPFGFAGEQGAFFERLRFRADQPCRIAVVPKDALDAPRWFEADFAMAYHFGDAYERDGRIVMRTVRHVDIEEARLPMRAQMSGQAGPTGRPYKLLELHLDLRSGRAHWQDTGLRDMEFPLFDTRSACDRGALLYAPVREGGSVASYFNAVAVFDAERGQRQVHRYGRDILAEEHVFVPRPGSDRADDGWLVGTLLDAARGRSGIAVLDARRVSDGPLAQAWLPYTLPLGFHGHFNAG